ncbi:MAG TPA: hypothetical protein DCR24_10105, partial [Bacillus bacterium]|nr:hypothetical protein [Bacillus sp. (in: firmicutes)]
MVNMILLFLTAGFLSYTFAGILLFINKKEILYNQRVVQFFEEPAKKDSKKTSTKKSMAINNLVSKYWERGTNYLNKKVSKEERRKIDTLLRDAGYPFKTAVDFRLFQFVLSAVIVMPILFFMLPAVENKMNIWLLALSGALLGFRLPVFYLGKKKTARIKLINKMMPDFFDT